MPKDKKALPRSKGKFGNLPLPVDLIEELRWWKLAYELAWSDPAPDGKQHKMTMEQLIRRLLEGVKRLDPEVYIEYEAAKKSREEQDNLMANFRRNYRDELLSIKKRLDSIFSGPEVWPEDSSSADTSKAAGNEDNEVKEEREPVMYFVHPDGRHYRAIRDESGEYAPVDPNTGKLIEVSSLDEGFELRKLKVSE